MVADPRFGVDVPDHRVDIVYLVHILLILILK